MRFTWRSASISMFLCAVLGASVLQALQQAPHMHGGETPDGGPAWTELMSSMDKMHAAMAGSRASGDTDTDFVRLMLPHHRAAVDMAKTELLHGKDPQMRRMAQEIITDQQSEIELMQRWLKEHESQK